MNILITGGAGFIGSNIVRHCIENNLFNRIRIVDNLSTGYLNNINEYLKDPRIEFIYGDISNLEVCRKALKNIDLICHQAALGSVPRSFDDPLSSHISNVNGFLNIILVAKENNIKRIVFASSSSVYGDNSDIEKKEEHTGQLLSPYAATKKIDEIYAEIFTKCYQMEIIGLRYFNVFGPKQNKDGAYAAVIPKFITSLLANESPSIFGDGSNSRDFTYIDNVIQANLLALTTTNPQCFGQIFNVGCNDTYSVKNIFEIIANQINPSIPPIYQTSRKGDIPYSKANIEKAETLLGYCPNINFPQGIVKTIQWYTEQMK